MNRTMKSKHWRVFRKWKRGYCNWVKSNEKFSENILWDQTVKVQESQAEEFEGYSFCREQPEKVCGSKVDRGKPMGAIFSDPGEIQWSRAWQWQWDWSSALHRVGQISFSIAWRSFTSNSVLLSWKIRVNLMVVKTAPGHELASKWQVGSLAMNSFYKTSTAWSSHNKSCKLAITVSYCEGLICTSISSCLKA